LEKIMTRLKLFAATAVLSTALAAPLMAQEATQEPGMIGFNYPNSHYMTGGYGVHTPYNTGRYPRMPYGGYVAYDYGPTPGVGIAVGPGVGVAVTPAPYPYDAYAYDPY
jgi:hypothetical protein